MEKYYEFRYIETSSVQSSPQQIFDEREDQTTLLQFLQKQDRVILLGNPGVGKTTELRNLFDHIWEKIDETGEVPLSLNLKNFRKPHTIEDLIRFPDWQTLSSIVFIFDGLDEIADIQDFISELEIFMIKFSHLNFKFVLSCRTNIYEKYLIDITGFETVYLKSLTEVQIKNILKNKYDITILPEKLDKYYSNIQTPFNLDLFAKYYLENNSFPTSVKESWELFINGEVEKAREVLLKRFQISRIEILKALEEIAITNELMQQNIISEEDLFKILGSKGNDIFQELPFIEKNSSQDSFVFRHKNYQEFFAAKYLSSLETNKILNFIKADDLNKIKPTLFNTTTFLLNILNDEKFMVVKDWLFRNDIEVLFYADEDRLSSDFKNEIFENFYNEYCIEKTFWLSHNGRVNTNILAKFASFEFLVSEILNSAILERARLSALEVLSYKELSCDQIHTIKSIFITLLRNENTYFQSDVLRAIKTLDFQRTDQEFLDTVIEIVKDSKDKDVSHQIIALLNSSHWLENNIDTLLAVVKNHFYGKKDNTIRGTEQLIASIILKTKDKELFLNLFKMLFDDHSHIRINNIYFTDFDSKLINKIKTFNADKEFKIKLVEYIFSHEYSIMRYDVLDKIVNESGIDEEIILHILNEHNFSRNILYTINKFLSKDSVDLIVSQYKNGEIKFQNDDDIASLRNWLSHNNLDLARYLENKFTEAGYNFKVPLITKEERDKELKNYEEFREKNFKLVFDKIELLKEIDSYFNINEITTLNRNLFLKLLWKWYDDTGYHGLQYTIHTVLEQSFFYKVEVNVETISNLLEDEFFYLSVIKAVLNHHSSKNLVIESNEINLIKKLTNQLYNNIDFENVVRFTSDDNDRFNTTKNYEFIKILLHFDYELQIIQNQNFYLKALEYGNLTGVYENKDSDYFNHMKERIGDVEEFNSQVIINLNYKRLSYIAQRDHILYAVENNLNECFEKVGEIIKSDKYLYNQFDILENYTKKLLNPLPFLKSCCSDINSYLCWESIKIIKNNNLDNNYVMEVAREYLKSEEMGHADQAVNILFYLNQDDALCNYNKIIQKLIAQQGDECSGFSPKDVLNYNHLNELDTYKDLFNIIYVELTHGAFYLHRSREFFQSLTINLSNIDEGYKSLIEILNKIKNSIESRDPRTYYVNNLIEICENSYLKRKSPKKSLDEVISILKNE
ncbi:NACHT domain-containing protein [Chryseobacterium gleum]|uniref:NACHT domain-containing protein n=1 Tax=Chryseobacterium gleum TaxID=250 RepID=UPI00289DD592|nr:hypothetical protein [Chryseobacterium gleum]